MEKETNLSPWPDADPGKTHADKTNSKHFRFEFRKAVWPRIRPWYGANNVIYRLEQITEMKPMTFWFPFFSVRLKYFHFYCGWKPIPVAIDPAFYWNQLDWVKEKVNNYPCAGA
jgi:hypothetical protein